MADAERLEDLSKYIYLAEGVPFDWNHHDYCLEVVFQDADGNPTEGYLENGDPIGYLGKGKCTRYDGTMPFGGIVKHNQWRRRFYNGSRLNAQQDQRIFIKTEIDFEIAGVDLPKLYLTPAGEYTDEATGNKLIGSITEDSISSNETGKFWSVLKITGVQ